MWLAQPVQLVWVRRLATMPQLGGEAFISIPGGMRQKFMAVVDMSNMGLDPGIVAPATALPFFTGLRPTGEAKWSAETSLTISHDGKDAAAGRLFVMSGERSRSKSRMPHCGRLALRGAKGCGSCEVSLHLPRLHSNYPGHTTSGPVLIMADGSSPWAPALPCRNVRFKNIRPGFPGSARGPPLLPTPKYKGVIAVCRKAEVGSFFVCLRVPLGWLEAATARSYYL